MASVELKGLGKRFPGGGAALRALSLQVADGELLSLVGPSGCGKSTTLNLVAGLEVPTEGEILIGGRAVQGLAPRERDVAMVFQSYALYPHLNVEGNLAFPLRMAGVPRAEREQRVREAAESLGLTPLLQRKIRELSGGQRQRVALGRALVRRPAVFLFDEPLSNLDANLRAQMRAELKLLHQRLRATFLYVTHDQVEAMTLSDRIALLKDGVLQQVGTPRELYDAPANTFVATFFGTPPMNLIPASAVGRSDAATVGVRPEDLELGLGDAPAGALPAQVLWVESLGAEANVAVELGGTRVIARAGRDVSAVAGAKAWLKADPSRWHRFDAAGVRL